jgi:hypothetical protein
MNLYEDIIKRGYTIEEKRGDSAKSRLYILDENGERIGYLGIFSDTKFKKTLSKEPISTEYWDNKSLLDSLRFPQRNGSNADKAIKDLHAKFSKWQRVEMQYKDFSSALNELIKASDKRN